MDPPPPKIDDEAGCEDEAAPKRFAPPPVEPPKIDEPPAGVAAGARAPNRFVEAFPPKIEPDVLAVAAFAPKREFPVPPKIEPEAVDELAFPPNSVPDAAPNVLPVELQINKMLWDSSRLLTFCNLSF